MRLFRLLLKQSLFLSSLFALAGICFLIFSGDATMLSISCLFLLVVAAWVSVDELKRWDDEGLLP